MNIVMTIAFNNLNPYDAHEHNFQEEFYDAQQPEDFFDAQEPDRFYDAKEPDRFFDAKESNEFEPINLSSARAIMTLGLPQQAPPDQLAHSSKVRDLQRAFATFRLLSSHKWSV